ncbi:DnaJ-domain-containing protein [Rozella allomycis CSF55]|uniref:DnaJ-domain-containing protein n=1 Tax=Rozella allomycis (strain CSF55) TaxID=988480 RepID=A0A4P9YKD9_ROZAC|nr:DnaJ-domain-containing protein [Rozella allomycis CSF55]
MESTEDEDFYAILNASEEDIKSSYRKLCLIFHPDKQSSDETRASAETQFVRIQRAYNVLIDQNRRYIYDRCGAEAAMQEWTIDHRQTTMEDILNEIERRKREAEKKRLEKGLSSVGKVTVQLNATTLFDPDVEEFVDRVPEIGQIAIQQWFERDFSSSSKGIAQFALATNNGYGSGVISFALQQRITFYTQLMVKRALDTTLKLSYLGGSLYPSLRIGFQRLLLGSTTGSISYEISKNPSISCGLDYKAPGTNRSVHLTFTDSSTDLSVNLSQKISSNTKIKGKISIGNSLVSLSYGASRRMSENSTVTSMVEVGSPGVLVYLKLGTGFECPIILSPQPDLKLTIIATVVPSLLAFAIKRFIIDPTRFKYESEEIKRKRQEKNEMLSKMKTDALNAIEILKEAANKKLIEETANEGIIIIKALYGNLEGIKKDCQCDSAQDVTIVLQSMVNQSQIHIPDYSKTNIIGFYDPCFGEEKFLNVRYKFKGKLHEVTVNDKESLSIPQRIHIVQ